MNFEDRILYDWKVPLLERAKAASDVVVLTDTCTSKYCLPVFHKHFTLPYHHVEIATGEVHKNITTAQEVWKRLVEFGIDRNALLLHLGGGVVTDLGGFCASVFKRGVDYIQIPTTLLAMVDAAIGGKNGIDFMDLKNYLGVIRLPQAVVVDPIWLDTLPEREWRSGAAEIIKAALIYDADLWREVVGITALTELGSPRIIERAITIKREVVSRDPYEKGLRKILNFGHTIGHAIESFFLDTDTPFTHGEAVAIGMMLETKYAHRYLHPTSAFYTELAPFLLKYYPPLPRLTNSDIEQIIRLMYGDKKNSGRKILSVVLEDIAVPRWDIELEVDKIKKILSE